MKANNLTTTNIGVDGLKNLRKLSNQHKLKQVEFINSAIDYFKKTGINPAAEIYTPREEIEMLRKRLEEVIKFFQVHERQKLGPLMERLILLEKKLSESYTDAITSSDIEKVKELMENLKDELESLITRSTYTQNAHNKAMLEDLSRIVDYQKHTIKLFAILFEALKNRSIAGGLKEVDVKNFQNALSKIR